MQRYIQITIFLKYAYIAVRQPELVALWVQLCGVGMSGMIGGREGKKIKWNLAMKEKERQR